MGGDKAFAATIPDSGFFDSSDSEPASEPAGVVEGSREKNTDTKAPLTVGSSSDDVGASGSPQAPSSFSFSSDKVVPEVQEASRVQQEAEEVTFDTSPSADSSSTKLPIQDQIREEKSHLPEEADKPAALAAASQGPTSASSEGTGDVARGGLLIKDEARVNSLRARLEAGEVVFAMENVAVHPSAAVSQRIRGRLRLVKQDPAVYLSWLPYTSAERPNGLDPKAKGQQYAIRAVSLSEIRSIRRQTPTLGWQYVIIVLNTGLAFPPLYFYDGGVRAFIAAVKEHASLIKSQDDPNVYLVNDTEDPLMIQRSLGTVRWQGAFANIQSKLREKDGAPVSSAENWERENNDGAIGGGAGSAEVPMQVLQGFAGLTRLARVAWSVTQANKKGDRVLGGPDAAERMPVRAPLETKAVQSTPSTQSSSAASSDLGHFEIVDPLQQVLAATKGPKSDPGPPFSHEEWIGFLDEEGRVKDKDALCAQIFRRGIEPELRREVWKFLLGYYPFESTYAERRQLDEEKRKEYQVYKLQWESVTETQARRFAKYRERVSRIEKDVVRTDRKLPQFLEDDSASFEVLRSILMTYSFYNFDLGYCQGMSDLLSPFVVIMEDEVEAFWCFAQFMETMGRNFNRDQTGMHSQLLSLSKLMRLLDEPLFQYLESIEAANLFCCFRWLLILFKREFEFEDVLKLWERLWTCPMTKSFHLYICCAILKRFRRNIIDEQMQFDALLRFINELSCRVDLDDVLQFAEALCLWAGKRGEACIPQPVEEELVLIEGPESGDH